MYTFLTSQNCFQFLVGITNASGEIENNAHAKSWGINKLYYVTPCDQKKLKEAQGSEPVKSRVASKGVL